MSGADLMQDLIFLSLGTGFFAVMALYALAAGRL
jgi:hypothetical protein